jgi:hypothetical protein
VRLPQINILPKDRAATAPSSVGIAAAAFCHHFRIKPTSTLLFQNVDIDNERVMHLDLMNTVTVTRGAR